jgi:hypothetical protein
MLILTAGSVLAIAQDLRIDPPTVVDPPPATDFGFPAPEEKAERIEQFRKDVFYVVDAWVVRKVERPQEIGSDGKIRREKEIRYAVFWDREPDVRGGDRTKLISEEWVVVDGTGRLLTPAQYAALSGDIGDDRPRRDRVMLDGVQLQHDREDVEEDAAERFAQALARARLSTADVEPIRDQLIATLPPTEWSTAPPAQLDDGA